MFGYIGRMSTLDKIKAIKPGWRVRVQNGPLVYTGVAVQHFGSALYFVPDGSDELTAARYEHVESGQTVVHALDTSGELDVEEVEGPWQGLSTTDVLGETIVEWAHEDPVQSGEVRTVVAHPKGGYDSPGPCIHSAMQRDCISCWEGLVHRQDLYVQRLRQMLKDAGAADALKAHDIYWFGSELEEQ